jgi:methylated-DNA-[protein]-cysteine S-methyltransferase
MAETTESSKIVETEYGWVGMAWSPLGLTSVTLPQQSREQARDALPAANREPVGEAPFDPEALADKLKRYFRGVVVDFDEPLDPRIGTAFQRRVWGITRAIPRGKTTTYAEIAVEASRTGRKAAARAVGQASARNPWPVIVPCHRVLGSDGGLTGFGGGLEMKRRMLELEGIG